MSETLRQGSYVRSDMANGLMADHAVRPVFRLDQVQDESASQNAGRPIFREIERVEILMPGGFNQPVFNVTDAHRQRWPREYEAFKKGQEVSPDGTPIDHWAFLSRAMVHELKALNIFSVEQCAILSDVVLQRIGMGGRQIRNAAIAYLDDAAAMAQTSQLTAENERLSQRVAELDAQVRSMSDLLAQVHAHQIQVANTPSAMLTTAPMSFDPIEQARQMQTPQGVGGASSLANLGEVRRRPGRPPRVPSAGADATEDAL